MLQSVTAWLADLLLLCKSKCVQPQRKASVSLTQMNHLTAIPPEDLSTWYFAIRWARFALEQQTAQYSRDGWATDYNNEVIQQLVGIEQQLQSRWDAYMESITQTPVEVLSHG